MILYIDRTEVPDVENPSPAVLRYCVEEAEKAAGRYWRLEAYYRGDHAIFHGERDGKEDVRVSANYAKYVVDTVLGYCLGEPVKYDANPKRNGKGIAAAQTEDTGAGTKPDSGETKPDSGETKRAGSNAGTDAEKRRQNSGKTSAKTADVTPEQVAPEQAIDLSPLLDCYDAQQISRIDVEIGRTMGISGDCLELCYASSEETPHPRSARIRPQNGILVEDSTVEHNKLFGIVWEKRKRISGTTYYAVTVYTDRSEQDYESTDLKTAVFRPVGARRPHYFGAVPVIAYENNAERQGDFEQIISLIDAYDRLLSDRVTDKRKFVDSLLVFFGMTLRDGDDEKLVREKFIDGAPLDARAEYIQKTFDEAGVQVLADALVREMHKMTMTVDMSDESFAGNSSGQALKLKLLTMDLLAKGKMRQLERGFLERFSLYNAWLCRAGRMAPVGVNDVDIVFTRALPINEQEVVQTVTSLQGIVDDQTLLSQLWFIRDPAEAAENIRQQKKENFQEYQSTFSAQGAEPDGGDDSGDEDAEEESKEGKASVPAGFRK